MMKYVKLFLIINVVIILGFKASSPIANYINTLKLNEAERFPEKTYIHTDKPYYTTKDTIWFKNYLVNGITHKQTNKSNVVYVELISPKDSILYKEKFYVSDNTYGAPGDIAINPEWESGKYQIRSYTNYMRNQDEGYFFKKSIYIEKGKEIKNALTFIDKKKLNTTIEDLDSKEEKSKIEKIDLVFYPEGGNVLANVQNKFGIKAKDEKGNGVKVLGAIKEKGKDEIITMFRTFDFGLGNMTFTPKKNIQYVAEIQLNGRVKRYILDKITTSSGVQLSIENNNEDLLLSVTRNKKSLEGYFLIGHMREKLFYSRKITEDKSKVKYKLITKDLPNGVTHFTLFDPTGKPKSERLVFIDNHAKTSKAKIIINNKTFKKRDHVSYNIEILDKELKKQNASLSLSVTHKNSIPLSIKENIKSWMLLNSDLRGEVLNAAVFFDVKKSKMQRDYLLESLMLTHGWRRFTWEDYLKEGYKDEKYKPEKGVNISGKVLPLDEDINEKKVETTLLLVGDDLWSDKQTVKANGIFSFKNIIVKDSVEAILQAKALGVKERKEKKVRFLLDEIPKSPSIVPLTKQVSEKENLFFENFKKIKNYIEQVNFTFKGVNQLGEVVVKGKEREEEVDYYDEFISRFSNSYYGTPSDRIIVDSVIGKETLTVFDLLRRVAGVRIVQNEKITIRGPGSLLLSTTPLILLDGLESSTEEISFLNGSDISVIDILKGNDAAIFGIRGNNGVIAIYTGTGIGSNAEIREDGIVRFKINPFYKAQEFYDKNYFKESDKKDIEPDYRTTLHWNPGANAYENQIVNTIFYTGDQTGVFQFELEGITEKGELIYETAEIEVKE